MLKKQTIVIPIFKLAEGVGFEPTFPLREPVFETGALNHSATPPTNYRSDNITTNPVAKRMRHDKVVKRRKNASFL